MSCMSSASSSYMPSFAGSLSKCCLKSEESYVLDKKKKQKKSKEKCYEMDYEETSEMLSRKRSPMM